jgi:hypothetical protein
VKSGKLEATFRGVGLEDAPAFGGECDARERAN